MRKGFATWHLPPRFRAILFCASLILCSVAFVAFHFASTRVPAITAHNHLTLQVSSGFNSSYRSNNWMPVYVLVSNSGPAFTGTLSAHTFSGDYSLAFDATVSPWNIEQPLALAEHAQKQITFYAPHYFSSFASQSVFVAIRDEQEHIITTQTSQPGSAIRPNDLLVGILAGPGADFTALNTVVVPHQMGSLTSTALNASTLPAIEAVLENFDVIVLDDFPTNTLSAAQRAALHTWVNRGGVLIEVGGPHWQRTLSALPADLLPITPHGILQLPAATSLLPTAETMPQPNPPSSATLPDPLPVSAATLRQQSAFSSNKVILAANTTPLIVQARQGSGVIMYLAFDPAATPLTAWSQIQVFWQMLFQHALGNALLNSNLYESYDSGPGQLLTRGGMLSLLQPTMPLTLWLLCALLLCYLLVLGPLCILTLKGICLLRLRGWRLIVCAILVFTPLTYGFAFGQKSVAPINNSISLIQVNQNGTSAHVTTYMGLFLPDQGNFHVHIPDGLAQPVAKSFLAQNPAITLKNDAPMTIQPTAHGTDLAFSATNAWTLHPIVAEQDDQLHGELTTHMQIRDNYLVGTITNTLSTSLSDIYILLPHSFVPIERLAAGETRYIHLPLHSAPSDAGTTLSAQIAAYHNIPASYFPNPARTSSASTLQRHMALLAALSGAGYSYTPCQGSCLTHAVINKGVIDITGGQLPNPNLKNDYDPLLVPGAPATLIGWADQPLASIDHTTVNGIEPAGGHTDFLQMPLNLKLSSSLHAPSDFITGNAITIQSADISAILPGFYSMMDGSVTFEMALPDTTQMQIRNMTVTVPDLIAHPDGQGSGIPSQRSIIQAQFFNWHTNAWENVPFTQDAFTTSDLSTYAGPYGRVLLQIASQNASLIYFGKPTLTLNGHASP